MLIDRWLAAFDADPEQAVGDLFSRRAGLDSSMRMDIPELLSQELFGWLETMRKDYARQVDRLGFAVYT